MATFEKVYKEFTLKVNRHDIFSKFKNQYIKQNLLFTDL